MLRAGYRPLGAIQVLRNARGVGGCMPKRYEALRGGGGGGLRQRYVTSFFFS